MTAIHETAYPRIRSNLSEQELHTLYTPTPDGLTFVHRTMKSTVAAFGGVVLLKTFQRLGYFPFFDALPARLIQHLATTMGLLLPRETLQQTASEHCLPQCGIKPIVSDARKYIHINT
jgi:hypothetical protein